MMLVDRCATKQVGYTNTFIQAGLKEEVYREQPTRFSRKDKLDMVLKIIESMHWCKQAPKRLKARLLERGFIQSEMDECLFVKRDAIFAVYVDNVIFFIPDTNDIEELIALLGAQNDEQCHPFELSDEGEVRYFLAIRIEK